MNGRPGGVDTNAAVLTASYNPSLLESPYIILSALVFQPVRLKYLGPSSPCKWARPSTCILGAFMRRPVGPRSPDRRGKGELPVSIETAEIGRNSQALVPTWANLWTKVSLEPMVGVRLSSMSSILPWTEGHRVRKMSSRTDYM